jgi:putative membrane protein
MEVNFFLLLLFVFLGIFFGIIAGLLPGIHANTIALLALSLSLQLNLELSVMLIALSLTQSFVDFIPAIFLGIPENENFISLLPGQKFFLKGKGFHALNLTIQGGFFAALTLSLIASIIFLFLIKTEQLIKALIPFVLFFVLIIMILNHDSLKKKISALLIITLSAILGLIVLNNNLILQPLFVLITGFFGISNAFIGLNSNKIKVKQEIKEKKINFFLTLKATFYGIIAGFIVSVSPSITSNAAALIVKEIAGKIKKSLYLMIIGASNTANYFLSFIVLIALGKTRTGIAVALKHLNYFNESHLLLIIAVTLTTIGIAAILTKFLGKIVLLKVQEINLKKINLLILVFLVLLCFLFSGFLGLIAMISAASIALLGLKLKVNRSTCMAFLIIPVLLNLII